MCGFDQPEVAFIDKVGKTQSLVLILFRYGNNETKVGFCQLLQRGHVSLLDSLGQGNLFVGSNQFNFTYLLQVFVKRCSFTIGNLLCNF